MARRKVSGLNDMRNNLEELGADPGLRPSVADLRSPRRKALGLACLCVAMSAFAGHAREGGKASPSDSLRALRVVISSEFKPGDSLLQIQDTRRADSLLRNVPTRGPLLAAIRDTALSRELRSRADFDAYWDKLEAASGHAALRKNLAAQDIDKTRIPKAYLFDSSVVVFPGWIVIRKRSR